MLLMGNSLCSLFKSLWLDEILGIFWIAIYHLKQNTKTIWGIWELWTKILGKKLQFPLNLLQGWITDENWRTVESLKQYKSTAKLSWEMFILLHSHLLSSFVHDLASLWPSGKPFSIHRQLESANWKTEIAIRASGNHSRDFSILLIRWPNVSTKVL